MKFSGRLVPATLSIRQIITYLETGFGGDDSGW